MYSYVQTFLTQYLKQNFYLFNKNVAKDGQY